MTAAPFWDEVASHVCMRRALVKRYAYIVMYGGSVDPWVDYFIREALALAVAPHISPATCAKARISSLKP